MGFGEQETANIPHRRRLLPYASPARNAREPVLISSLRIPGDCLPSAICPDGS